MSFSDGDISREARERVGSGMNEFEGPIDNGGIAGITVSVTGQDTLDRAQKLLAGIPDGVDKAVKSAMKRTASHLRAESSKAIRKRYAIKAAYIRSGENAQISYSYQDGVQAYIFFEGQRLPLYRFDGASPAQPTKDESQRYGVMTGLYENEEGKWRYLYPSVSASGHVLKSTSPYQFESAFVAKMKSGHVGIFERTGGMTVHSKDEIEELYGPSVPQMLGHQEVAEKLTEEAMQTFDERLDHEVTRILNGWGG